MDSGQAIAVCAFGWGKEFRLYHDYLCIEGKHHRLCELTQVQSTFRTVLGISSACLELQFGRKKLVLRGIAAIDDARNIAAYLTSWCQNMDTYTLPVVPVPICLVPGEQAHYSANATLCGERLQETFHTVSPTSAVSPTYPAQDHGLLIVTNKRIMYVGRKSQIVLDYTHLLHVSRLRGAIAFEADHWQKRVIFTLSHPEECAAYIEAILHAHDLKDREKDDVNRNMERVPVMEDATTRAGEKPTREPPDKRTPNPPREERGLPPPPLRGEGGEADRGRYSFIKEILRTSASRRDDAARLSGWIRP